MKIRMKFPGFLDKALTLSYDDGVTSDKKMTAILNQYGIKCTFNINTRTFPASPTEYPAGKWGRMTAEECKAAYVGHEVAVHTLTHPNLPNLPVTGIVNEVFEDKRNIERLFGTVVRGMAYPYGGYDERTVSVLKDCGIVYSRTTASTGDFSIPPKESWLTLPATCHHLDGRFGQITDRFLEKNTTAGPWLFYLWGHSYEFERDGNWDLLENFCAKVGGRDDIWYAVNIDVFDYISAYYALCFDADCKRVYNPSAVTVFFSAGDKNYAVKPGQTLELN